MNTFHQARNAGIPPTDNRISTPSTLQQLRQSLNATFAEWQRTKSDASMTRYLELYDALVRIARDGAV